MLLLVRVPSSVAMAGTVATGYWQQRRVINLALDFIAADAVVIDDHGWGSSFSNARRKKSAKRIDQ
jgi:hypothetical protein